MGVNIKVAHFTKSPIHTHAFYLNDIFNALTNAILFLFSYLFIFYFIYLIIDLFAIYMCKIVKFTICKGFLHFCGNVVNV